MKRYYLKEKCTRCPKELNGNERRYCPTCKGKGFIRGSDVTELIERIKDYFLVKNKKDFERLIEDLIEVIEE